MEEINDSNKEQEIVASDSSKKTENPLNQADLLNYISTLLEGKLLGLEEKFKIDINETLEGLKYEFFEQNLRLDECAEVNSLDDSQINVSFSNITLNPESNDFSSPDPKKGAEESKPSDGKKVKKLGDLKKITESKSEKVEKEEKSHTPGRKENIHKEPKPVTDRERTPNNITKNKKEALNRSVIIESSKLTENKSDIKKKKSATNKKDKEEEQNTPTTNTTHNTTNPTHNTTNTTHNTTNTTHNTTNTTHNTTHNTTNTTHNTTNSTNNQVNPSASSGKKVRKSMLINNKRTSLSMIIDPKEMKIDLNSRVDPRKSPRQSMMEYDIKRIQQLKEMRRGSTKSTKTVTKDPPQENQTNEVENINKVSIELKNIITVEGKKLPCDFDHTSNSTKALFLTVSTKFLDIRDRYKIAVGNKIIKNNFDCKSLLNEKLLELEKKLATINEDYARQLDDPITSALISKMFTPSKIASNGLNFITKEEESNLCKKEQCEDVLDVFRIIYIILNEVYTEIPKKDLIENLFTNILPKIKAENLKNQLSSLALIIKNNPKILSPNDFIKINRSMSYMTFIIKEAWDYFSLKNSEGVLIFTRRQAYFERNALGMKIFNIQNLLN